MTVAGVSVVTWLAFGYAVALLVIAYGIDTMARRSAERVDRQRQGGFTYHADHDGWLCPQDQWLWPKSFDPDNRVMRYRGSPSICNACPVKHTCTASTDGREVSRAVDTWPASEAARFHRGIACAVTVLAVLWPLAWAATRPVLTESVLLLLGAFAVCLGALPLWSHLRRSPADPGGVLVQSLDETVQQRAEEAVAQLRRRTSYRSDRRAESVTEKQERTDVT